MFQELAERHLRRALIKPLIAAADPTSFIDDSMMNEFAAIATDTWNDGRGLVLSLADTELTPLFNNLITANVQVAKRTWYEMLTDLIDRKGFPTDRAPIFGEFIQGNLVQYGDVRPMLVALGGGAPTPEVHMVGGITSGQTMKDWLGQNGIQTDEKIWLYGYEDEPRRTFNGHLQMDGLVFSEWDDDSLKVAPQDFWLRRTHYAPGDHFGCACVVAPFIPNFGDEYVIDV